MAVVLLLIFGSSTFFCVFGYFICELLQWLILIVFRFPHLVDGAVASSPGVTASLGFAQILKDGGNAYRAVGGDLCYDSIYAAMQSLDALLSTDNGRTSLQA